MAVSGTDNDSQMRALLLHRAKPDVKDIFMHLENVGTTGKAEMDALNNHFEPKKNVAFERHVFRQAIQETNKPSINFVTRLCKLASTCEFANHSAGIQNHFIDKCSPNFLSCRLLQEPNLTLEEVIEKNQAMELAEKQSIVMYRTKCRLVWQG